MRRISQKTLFCALLLTIWPAFCQTPPTPLPPNADDNSPWGGVPVPPPPGAPMGGPSNPDSSSFCSATDPCVLTGQYNRYRTSHNSKETSLAGFNNANFGLAYLYQINNPPTCGDAAHHSTLLSGVLVFASCH